MSFLGLALSTPGQMTQLNLGDLADIGQPWLALPFLKSSSVKPSLACVILLGLKGPSQVYLR